MLTIEVGRLVCPSDYYHLDCTHRCRPYLIPRLSLRRQSICLELLHSQVWNRLAPSVCLQVEDVFCQLRGRFSSCLSFNHIATVSPSSAAFADCIMTISPLSMRASIIDVPFTFKA